MAGGGYFAQYAMEKAGITVNKNTIPVEPSSPFYPSGVLLGTPALTTRGMKEADMEKIASWIVNIIDSIQQYRLPVEKEARLEYLKKFRNDVDTNAAVKRIRKEIYTFASSFPIFAW